MENKKLIHFINEAYNNEESKKRVNLEKHSIVLKTLEKIRKKIQLAIKNNNSIPKIKNLYSLLSSEDLLFISYVRLFKNRRTSTLYSERESIDTFSSDNVAKLSKALITQTFKWKNVKNIEICKKSKKLRFLNLFDYSEEIVQNNILMILESIYEPIFEKYNCNYGFGSHKSRKSSIETIVCYKNQDFDWGIEGNIAEVFDNFHPSSLAKILAEIIDDKNFINIIYEASVIFMVKKNKVVGNSLIRIIKSTILFPMLFNIYMHKFDIEIENIISETAKLHKNSKTLKNPKFEEYVDITYQIRRFNKEYKKIVNLQNIRKLTREEKDKIRFIKIIIQKLKIKRTYIDRRQYNKINFRYFYNRCFDEFILLINQDEKMCSFIKGKIEQYLYKKLNLILCKKKIKIINLKEDRLKYLGYVIFMSNKKFVKKVNNNVFVITRRKLVIGIDQNKFYEMLIKNNYAIINTLEPTHCIRYIKFTPHKIIEKYNSIILRIYNYYYNVITYKSQLNRIWYILYFSALRTLACKHQSTISKIINMYRWQYCNKSKYSISCIRIVVSIKAQTLSGPKIYYLTLINRQDIQDQFLINKINREE